ncbi:BCCT family transporter [Marinomonas mediterranea]|jgi:choline/carnitine/betaine transport|uniref:Choline/carnitine/betaine transporter n=1 Tax=Marinomonas mediterranea (strain ATCC 700492 / JCM 21426 / NBRC 103028 / MMB-1) TaxID=717774 RepID=F2K027_MARM1|nr:BCCT family transporter [Marinomonas mediterranea]ADZ93241.1 choline/carnitine/betaine transporter [Marinomonas mediterranea MMB-1]WCN11129.1 BCCT family transporter [Marinomonas mediterranea]WCN15192.1 BCCT family transporter [Marinomonas mediterranea]WCN19236.1 BCCT family transporter [Marinomonas mediterranea MMB-1]
MDQSKPNSGREEYDTKYKIGQDNVQFMGLDVHNPVFSISALLILVFIIGAIAFPNEAKETLLSARGWSINNFDWFFMIAGNIFVLFCLALIVLPLGKIKLGGSKATPEHSTLTWFCMLFAAGMGIGLMFWSVAEPVAYYTGWYGTPLNVEAKTPDAESLAMGATMFHWGLHPWAIYGVVALSLAFVAYNKGLPLTIRSAFYPLFGDKVWGALGHFIDILSVIATIFGLATSLGFGAQQATSGLNFLFGIPNTLATQIVVIAVVTSVAIISVARGLEGGVKLLSNVNMIIAALLAIFVLIVGNTGAILASVGTLFVGYVENIIPLSNWIGRDDTTFYHGWTVFYWAWWISWSPFVGMFIARVSRGRTVREFIIAVLLVPTLVSIVWMAIFGGSAIEQVENGVGALANGISDASLAMFQMFEQLPLTSIISFVAIVLVLVFFVTSSDSGSLVIDGITAGGKTDAPMTQRIFWAVLEGVIAVALLVGGGSEALTAIQAAAITIGLPFTLLMLLMCVSLWKGLRSDMHLIK